MKDEYEFANVKAHINGYYNVHALLSTVGNMFQKKEKYEYPKNPFGHEEVDTRSDEQKVEDFFLRLERMGNRFIQENNK